MTEQWKVEYDKRQCGLMVDHLQRFEEGRIDLGTLIAGLDSLLATLEAPGKVWMDEFRQQWGTLEEIYAVALYRIEQNNSLNLEAILKEPDNEGQIKQTIEKIRKLVTNHPPCGQQS